jgi:hypothetical protein
VAGKVILTLSLTVVMLISSGSNKVLSAFLILKVGAAGLSFGGVTGGGVTGGGITSVSICLPHDIADKVSIRAAKSIKCCLKKRLNGFILCERLFKNIVFNQTI